MIGVRFRDDGFEGKCDYCKTWWPIEREFWYPRGGVRRCKACHAQYKRLHEAGRRADEITGELMKTRARERYRMNRTRYAASQKAWRDANKERVAAYNRQWREANRERMREQAKAYYAEARDVILAKKRQAYAGERAA